MDILDALNGTTMAPLDLSPVSFIAIILGFQSDLRAERSIGIRGKLYECQGPTYRCHMTSVWLSAVLKAACVN